MSDSPHKENTPQKPIREKARPSSGKAKNKLAYGVVIVTAILAVIGLIYFGSVLVSEYYAALRSNSINNTGGKDGEDSGEPISILPQPPGGVTIIEKQAELQAPVIAPGAPIASGSQLAQGYGMELGFALSFSDLTNRFAKIVADNGPENFQRLEPRAVLTDTVTGLAAKLLVGPFDKEQDAKEACEVLLLPEDIVCVATRFEGELIARE